MGEILRASDGSIIEPSLHDSKLIRIDFGRQLLSLFFQCTNGIFIRLLVRNIELMKGSHLAEENTILDFVITDGVDVTEDALSALLSVKAEAQLKYFHSVQARLANGRLCLVEFSPSYGGEIAIICEAVSYEQVARPF